MSQTLTPFPALPAVQSPAGAATLAGNIAAIVNLDNRETVAFSVIAKIHSLNAAGGFNYINNHDQLRVDAAGMMGGFGLMDFSDGGELVTTMQAVIEWNSAYFVDTTITTSVYSIVAEMKKFRETPESTLFLIYQYLNYCLSLFGK